MAGYIHSVASIDPGDTITYRMGRHVATHRAVSVDPDKGTVLVEIYPSYFEVVRAAEIETVGKGR